MSKELVEVLVAAGLEPALAHLVARMGEETAVATAASIIDLIALVMPQDAEGMNAKRDLALQAVYRVHVRLMGELSVKAAEGCWASPETLAQVRQAAG